MLILASQCKGRFRLSSEKGFITKLLAVGFGHKFMQSMLKLVLKPVFFLFRMITNRTIRTLKYSSEDKTRCTIYLSVNSFLKKFIKPTKTMQ